MGLGIVIGLCGLLSSVWHGRQASAINAQVNAGRANAASNTPPLPVAGVDHAMQRAEVWQERSRLISRMSTWTMWILVFAGAGLQATAARRRRAASQGG